jgi:DNA-binding LytR/AlgR family response regulator
MEKFNCLIIEDEPLAAEVLSDYVGQVPFLHLKATCADAIYALELLQQTKIDLIFLDINLPKLKGYDFLRTLHHPPKVIITTAYREYALEGYDLNVVDYLLKPVEFSRFLTAVNKIKSGLDREAAPLLASADSEEPPYLLVNVNKKRMKVYLGDILFIESRKEYINIVTQQQAFLTKYPLGEIDQQLDKANFLRVHRSFIVSRKKISAFNAVEVDIAGTAIPIGRSYKELVLSVLGTPI